ncbi:hypothetical protein ACFS7Z_08645 [Pontibacter toksunensis]|uniref:Uncharacterized protein n=1 Tax=Pontibacter toksunensis TaxID=1332631 RepID=A0ABW6BVI6_9BACT
MTDEEFSRLVQESRDIAYNIDLDHLPYDIQALDSLSFHMKKYGNHTEAFSYWVQYKVAVNVYEERVATKIRKDKIDEIVSDIKDTDFIDSLDIHSLFSN